MNNGIYIFDEFDELSFNDRYHDKITLNICKAMHILRLRRGYDDGYIEYRED